jgi:hypothetical protein
MGCWPRKPMSLLGHSRPIWHVRAESALPSTPDLGEMSGHVSFVPTAEIGIVIRLSCPLAAEDAKASSSPCGQYDKSSDQSLFLLSNRLTAGHFRFF